MAAHHYGAVPGLAAPDAAANLRPAGAASLGSDAVAPAELNTTKESALAAQAAQSREQNESQDFAGDTAKDQA